MPNEPASIENLTDADRDSLAQLAQSMATDPATRETFLRMTKKISPGTPVPEIDIKDNMAAFAKPHLERISSLENVILRERAEKNIERERAKLMGQGFKEAEVGEIEKWMVANSVPKYETAAEFFKLQQRTAEPSTAGYRSMSNEMPTDALAEMKKGPSALNNWARKTAAQMIADFRSGKTRAV